MIKAVVYGATGYTGRELLRILSSHKEVKIECAVSRRESKNLGELLPEFVKTPLEEIPVVSPDKVRNFDVAFLALPHGTSAHIVPQLVERGKIIDLSADFRLPYDLYKKYYGEHPCPQLIEEACYGLPELFEIKGNLIANPGCYPTAVLLGLKPLAELASEAFVSANSGTSGAGREASSFTHHPETCENLKPYKVGSHRHTPEMEFYSGVKVVFTPVLSPLSRGILAVIQISFKRETSWEEIKTLFEKHYSQKTFIKLLPKGAFPETKRVYGSNFVEIGWWVEGKKGVVITAIDNLVKGASGQAVQNMNLLFGLPEEAGLLSPPVFP